MKLNKYEISIIALIILVIFGVGYHIQPFQPAKAKIDLENRIDAAEDYYQEAKALALSMPLLNDSAVSLISDSLIITLVELNMSWVVFVRTQDGFESYTDDIQTLNTNLEALRVRYNFERDMRKLVRDLKNITPRIKKKEKGQQV